MKSETRSILLLLAILAFAPFGGFAQVKPASPVETFWSELQKLCGKAFAGSVAAAPANDTTFAGKELKMHVRSCDKDRIRIPFAVGDDLSRTWIFTLKDGRIELRHDHRHKDGKPDTVTMYGGWTTNAGTSSQQLFPADQKTVDAIAGAANNVWWVDLVPGGHYGYNVRRLGTERQYSIKFDITKPIGAPPAPWGWKD
jgi:hypothetical protein